MSDARNVDQLRARIDSGQSGDKMPWPDPAAAPLGTDEEAAGTPPTREAVAVASRLETGRPVKSPSPAGRGLGHAWWLIIISALIAVSLLVAVPLLL
jgi:hypothetical protein